MFSSEFSYIFRNDYVTYRWDSDGITGWIKNIPNNGESFSENEHEISGADIIPKDSIKVTQITGVYRLANKGSETLFGVKRAN